jgi:predicted flap endonuclease-1-like 5' DNA nuclease
MPSHLLPVLAKQGLGGVLLSQVPDVFVLSAVCRSSLSPASLFGKSSNSSSSSMLLQNRHVAAIGGAAPAAADNGTVRRTPVKVHASTSKKASKASSSPGSARAAAGVPEHKVLKAVPGMGKVYLERLQAQGISSLDKLAEIILAQLTRQDAQEAFSPGVKYLQVRHIM